MHRPNVFVSVLLLSVVAFAGGCNRSDASQTKSEAAAVAKPDANGRVNIEVTSDGFTPALTHVKVGQPVTLVVTRKVEKTCATEIVMDSEGINRPLPLNEPVEVKFTPSKAGKIPFSCAMHMVSGELVAE
ncbi:MAG TPA: cupredoxin domain-containing protein [Polyangiaceae bacterium]|nr:cupredoxin domain-containing protein [Polyangiaceae bacterium]